MPVTYYEEYSAKKLNEVVLLGSHDAGIYKGNANTRTQTDGIRTQALHGARFFDLRIGAFVSKSGNLSLRAYHDDTKTKDYSKTYLQSQALNTRNSAGQMQVKTVSNLTVHNTNGGAKGGGLYDMLGEAKAFVTDGATSNEFLILKFDKSTNWPHIADACLTVLGDHIYRPADGKGNLNECTLEDLKGTVVVLFTSDGCVSCGYNGYERKRRGILQWKNLYDKKATEPGGYSADFDGLQYYGKGGVSKSGSGQSGKIKVNASAQTLLMKGQGSYKTEDKKPLKGNHAGMPPAVVGVMYWTTTGPSWGGIQERNQKMWSSDNQKLLVQCTGLAQDMLPSSVNVEAGGSANTIKQFMPNIVMVDFVTEHQGRLVKALNTKSATEIRAVINGQGNGNNNGNNHNGHNNV